MPAPTSPPNLHPGHPSPPPPRSVQLRRPPARQPHTHFRSSPAHSDTDGSSTPSSQAEGSLPPEKDPSPPLQRDRSRPVAVGAVRRPTPDLKGEEERLGQRHHLNLTTPITNALFSPSKDVAAEHKVARTEPVSPKYRRDMKSRAPIFPTDTVQSEGVSVEGISHGRSGVRVLTVRKEEKSKSRAKKLKVQAPKTAPLDLARLDQKQYHSSSSAKKEGRCKSAHIRQTQDGLMCTVCGVNLEPLAAAAQRWRTHTAARLPAHTQDGSPLLRHPPVRECGGGRTSPDLDSVSSLSMTSCSVASEVLERARERRDHFWAE